MVAAWAAQIGCQLPPGDAQLAADDFFLTHLCGLVEPCCVANLSRPAPDIATCKAFFAKNGFSRDTALQSACLTELHGLASGHGATCLPERWNLSDPCVRLMNEPSGAGRPGERCTRGADCAGAPGVITACPAGECMQVARGQAGDGICLGDVSTGGSIGFAPFRSPTMPVVFAGVTCELSAGLYCARSTDASLQVCSTLKTTGASCDQPDACASGYCQLDARGTRGVCTAPVPGGPTAQALSVLGFCQQR